jgi:hypothetical protein
MAKVRWEGQSRVRGAKFGGRGKLGVGGSVPDPLDP